MYKKHYQWALANPNNPIAKTFLNLAKLYTTHQDAPTLALLQASAIEIEEKEWK